MRVIGTPILLGLVFAPLWWDYANGRDIGLRLLLLLVMAVGYGEFVALCRGRGYRPDLFAGVAALGLMLMPFDPLPFLVAWLMLRIVAGYPKFRLEDFGLTLLGVLFIGMLAFLVGVADSASVEHRLGLLLFLVATAKGSDIAAFCVGKTIGRHRMAPAISPAKTWEGAIGGAVVGTAAGWKVWTLFFPHDTLAVVGLALLVTVAAQIGDLVESVFKRWAGVKDSGRLLPGFGGMLDMTDSFYLSVPVTLGLMALMQRFL